VHFQNKASDTSKKYLPETMGAEVTLFDYDRRAIACLQAAGLLLS
jgi:hypothetical protein